MLILLWDQSKIYVNKKIRVICVTRPVLDFGLEKRKII